MPSTRTAVAVLALVAVAGCLGSPPTGDGTPTAEPTTTPAPTTDRPTTDAPTTATPTTRPDAARTTRDCYHEGFEVEASAASPSRLAGDVATPVPDLRYEDRRLVQTALANGSATTTALGDHAPLDDGRVVSRNGTYYRLERTTARTEDVTADEFELDGPLHEEYDPEAYAAAEESAVPFEELPAPDRRLFHEGTPGGERLDRLVSGGGSLAAGFHYAFRNASARNASTLVEDGPHYVAFRGTYWRVAPTGDRASTHRVTHRYRSNRTADSAAAFGERLVDRHAVAVNDSFDGAARELLVRAIEDGGAEWSGCEGEAPAGYEALADGFRDVPPSSRLAYVTYRGDLYRVTVSHAIE